MKILLIEDSQTALHKYSKILTQLVHEVIGVDSGELALQTTERLTFDLIVCDIEMPGLNGFETVSLFRELQEFAHTRVIVLSAKSAEPDLLSALEAGADDYIVKSANHNVFSLKIQALQKQICP